MAMTHTVALCVFVCVRVYACVCARVSLFASVTIAFDFFCDWLVKEKNCSSVFLSFLLLHVISDMTANLYRKLLKTTNQKYLVIMKISYKVLTDFISLHSAVNNIICLGKNSSVCGTE